MLLCFIPDTLLSLFKMHKADPAFTGDSLVILIGVPVCLQVCFYAKGLTAAELSASNSSP